MYHFFLPSNRLRELYIKLIYLSLFLKVVANQSTSTVRHLTQTIRKPFVHLIAPSVSFLAIRHLIRHMPYVMRYKSLHEVFLVWRD